MSTNTIFSTSSSTTTARRVARAAMIVMVGGLLSGVAKWFGGSFREIIESSFGATNHYEFMIYMSSLSVPLLIFNSMTRSTLANAFLPTFVSFFTREQHEEGWRLASAVANWLIIGSLLAVILTPWFVRNFRTFGLPPESTQWSALWIVLILVLTVISSLSGLMMGLLNAYEHFLIPAIVPMIYYIVLFFGTLVLTPYLGLFGYACCVLLGVLAGALIQWLKLRQFGAHYTFTLGWRDPIIWPSLCHVTKLLIPSVLGSGVRGLMLLVNTYIVSYYSIELFAYLDYAEMMIRVPTAFFAGSIAIAIFPTFSRMAAKNDKAGMGEALARTLRGLLFVAMPLAMALLILPVPIIQLFFEGDAFNDQSTLALASAVGLYGLAIIPYFLIEVIHRAFFAIQDTLRPLLIGVVALLLHIALHIALSLMLVSSLEPLAALSLANSIAATMEVLLLLWVLSRKIGGIGARALLSSTVRLAIAAGVMGVVLYAMLQVLALISLPIFIFVPLTIAVGGIIYFATAWRLGVEETRLVPRMILRQK